MISYKTVSTLEELEQILALQKIEIGRLGFTHHRRLVYYLVCDLFRNADQPGGVAVQQVARSER